MDIVAGATQGRSTTGKYVRCPEHCQQGLIFAYRHVGGVQSVSTWFVCAVCEGSGKVPAVSRERMAA